MAPNFQWKKKMQLPPLTFSLKTHTHTHTDRAAAFTDQ